MDSQQCTQYIQYEEKLPVYTNTHSNISTILYHQTTKSNKQRLLYVLFDASTGWANKMLPLFNHTQVFKCEFIQNFYSKICDKKH